MGQSLDRIRYTTSFSAFNIAAKKVALTAAIHNNVAHTNKICTLTTGWAHDDTIPLDVVAAMDIVFLVAKNSLSEAQIVALGHLLANSMGEMLVSAERMDVENYAIL